MRFSLILLSLSFITACTPQKPDADMHLTMYGPNGTAKKKVITFDERLKAAENGSPSPQVVVGLEYAKIGEIIEAAKWYRQAAAPNYHGWKFSLGLYYLDGIGVEKDTAKAIEYLTSAAKHNYLPAQALLGLIYGSHTKGNYDNKKALYWSTKAAEQGHITAQVDLAARYTFGEGVEKDFIKSYAWAKTASVKRPTVLSQAEKEMLPMAHILLQALPNEMTKSDIAKAEELANTYIKNTVPRIEQFLKPNPKLSK